MRTLPCRFWLWLQRQTITISWYGESLSGSTNFKKHTLSVFFFRTDATFEYLEWRKTVVELNIQQNYGLERERRCREEKAKHWCQESFLRRRSRSREAFRLRLRCFFESQFRRLWVHTVNDDTAFIYEWTLMLFWCWLLVDVSQVLRAKLRFWLSIEKKDGCVPLNLFFSFTRNRRHRTFRWDYLMKMLAQRLIDP